MLHSLIPQPTQEVAALLAAAPAITQDAVALAFAAKAAGWLRYDHDRKCWFTWDTVCWRQEKKPIGFQFARKLARMDAVGGSKSDLKEAGKSAFAAGVERFAQGDEKLSVTSEIWDRDPWLLGTPGGTVDLRTGLLRPARPEDNITKLTAVTPAASDDCPLWLEFVHFVTRKDAELNRFLQQWFGYCLTGDIREHALVFGYGPGRNGKGVLINTISGILGDYAVTAPMDTFTASRNASHPTDLAMLMGARLVAVSETERGRAWAESRIKTLTGGDPITARFMRQDFFTFLPEFKLFIVGNHKPILRNVDEAARQRFNIVPFLAVPKKKDLQLAEKLKPEWPAILRWCIDGGGDWIENGLVRPASVIAETEAYFAEQDVFAQWLEEKCDCEPGNRYKTETVGNLYAAWTAFAKAAAHEPGNRQTFSDELAGRGFERHRTTTAREFRGIQFRQAQAEE